MQSVETITAREKRIENALFRGANLHLGNAEYRANFQTISGALLKADLSPCDLTVESLGFADEIAEAVVMAREPGIAAGLEEAAALFQAHEIQVRREKNDGDEIENGMGLLHLKGSRAKLLALERVALNIVQRMSGIATATYHTRMLASSATPEVRVVGTRKTPWGLMDKRAIHLGGGGTHRIGLGDAILVKNNHLALISDREEIAAPIAIKRAWARRAEAAFIEVEVRSAAAARAAAQTFRDLQASSSAYSCLLLLDNMSPHQISEAIAGLREAGIFDSVLLEASGNISEENIEQYAASGVDAISIGALTHSARALDICQRIL